MKTIFPSFPLLVLLGLPGAALAGGQDDQILAELQKLNQTVEQLQSEVADLKGQLEAVTSGAVVVPGTAASGESGGLVQRVADAIHLQEDRGNYPWMDKALWEQLEEGMSEDAVIAILGEPTLNEPSLHKRIDVVFTYQGRRAATGEKVLGKIKFYRGKAVEIARP